MKKKIAIVLSCLVATCGIMSAEATYCEPVGNNGAYSCYTAEDAYKSGYSAGYGNYGRGNHARSVSSTSIKVPSSYNHFSSDYKNGYRAGGAKRYDELNAKPKPNN